MEEFSEFDPLNLSVSVYGSGNHGAQHTISSSRCGVFKRLRGAAVGRGCSHRVEGWIMSGSSGLQVFQGEAILPGRQLKTAETPTGSQRIISDV